MTIEDRQKEFSDLVKKALERFPITTIMRLFGASKPTVLRWANGISCPHPAVMPMTERKLQKFLNESPTQTRQGGGR
ncbi:MAG: hypothetical protein AAB731_04935 [Patescibacteria group bacterium]